MMARAIVSVVMAVLFWLPAGAAAALPAYRIVSEDGDNSALRVSVRLGDRQGETDLQAIAEDVRIRLPAGKIVRNVLFFLPSTALTEKAWAEVRLMAEPSVTVFGLRLDEEDAYRAEAASDRRARVGIWLTSPPALAGRLTIYRDSKGQPFAEWRLRNGQITTDALDEIRTNRGRRFVVTESEGGYYQLGANGTLELGSQGRTIAVAEPLKVDSSSIATPSPSRSAPPVTVRPVNTQISPQSPSQASFAGATANALDPVVEIAGERPVVIRRARIARTRPEVRQANATANDAISRALGQ